MCVYVCVCLCVCDVSPHICLGTNAYARTYIHTYIRTYIHMHMHSFMRTYIHIHMPIMQYTHIHMICNIAGYCATVSCHHPKPRLSSHLEADSGKLGANPPHIARIACTLTGSEPGLAGNPNPTRSMRSMRGGFISTLYFTFFRVDVHVTAAEHYAFCAF